MGRKRELRIKLREGQAVFLNARADALRTQALEYSAKADLAQIEAEVLRASYEADDDAGRTPPP